MYIDIESETSIYLQKFSRTSFFQSFFFFNNNFLLVFIEIISPVPWSVQFPELPLWTLIDSNFVCWYRGRLSRGREWSRAGFVKILFRHENSNKTWTLFKLNLIILPLFHSSPPLSLFISLLMPVAGWRAHTYTHTYIHANIRIYTRWYTTDIKYHPDNVIKWN